MSGMNNPVTDDRVELVDEDNVGIGYRLRKCGRTRLVIIAVVVLLVIGAIVAVAVILTRGTNADFCMYMFINFNH